jgi:hypothetical protein
MIIIWTLKTKRDKRRKISWKGRLNSYSVKKENFKRESKNWRDKSLIIISIVELKRPITGMKG